MSTNPATAREGQYSYGFVAYLDIVGWKALVEESVNDSEKFLRILAAAQAMGRHRMRGSGSSLHPGFEISQISDCILLTSLYRGDIIELDGFYLWLQWVSLELLSLGLFVRGGVTNGWYYHRGSIAFGPAVNEAAALEEKGNHAMRIVFGENALMNMNGRPITNMRKDGDIYFFDVLASQPRNHPEEEGLLNHIRPHIEQHLITHKNGKPAVYEKYVWYANYFNQVAKECGAKPIDF